MAKKSSLFTAVFVVWLLGVVTYVAIAATVIYVVAHFVAKFW